MPAFVVSIREGLEAVLILSILFGSLQRLGRMDLARCVWLGVGTASAISIGVAAALTAAGVELVGKAEAVFEGGTLLLAATVLTGMLFWMRGQGATLGARLASDVQRASRGGAGSGSSQGSQAAQYGTLALFSVAFLAVVREGIELALLLAASVYGSSIATTVTGAVLGLGVSAMLGILLFRGVVRLHFKRFFQASNIIMIVFAAGMVGLGVHEFVEAGLLPGLISHVWDIGPVLSDQSTVGGLLRSLFGYTSDPALIEIMAYLAYLSLVGWALYFRRRPQPVVASQ